MSEEDENASDFSCLRVSAYKNQRSCKTTSGNTSQNKKSFRASGKPWPWQFRDLSRNEQAWFLNARAAKRSNVVPQLFLLTSIPRSFLLPSEEVRLVSTYLRARVIPLIPVLPPHPAWSEPPTEEPTLGDVTRTATPLSTKPCANPAKRQIRHEKLSLREHAAALPANEPANRWQYVHSVP